MSNGGFIMKKMHTLIFAHRGASGLVPFENTIDAFQKAIEVGADGIELDIRKTSDNVIIVNHNPTIGEMTISDHTFEELQAMAKQIGFTIATLEETLIYCKGKIFLDIEFKEAGYEQQALDLILSHLSLKEFYIRSFNKDCLKALKAINPEVFTILLMCPKDKKFKSIKPVTYPKDQIKEVGANGVSPYQKAMLFGYIKRMHRLGYPVSAWTVNEEKDMEKWLRKGIDCIINNYPDKALALRYKYEK